MILAGSSLRTHNRIAVDAVTGSSPLTRAVDGITAMAGSAAKRMMMKPITAFQNPATIQGKVTANSTSAEICEDAESAWCQRKRCQP